MSIDNENNRYVIENVDSSITSLQPGDIFSYRYSEDEVLIIKVASISIDGTTATIVGAETSMEEVFDYVKIDAFLCSLWYSDKAVRVRNLLSGSR